MKQFGEKRLYGLANDILRRVRAQRKELDRAERDILLLIEKVEEVDNSRAEYVANQIKEEIRKMQAKVDAATGKTNKVAADEQALARAKTFAVLDSILFSIENWATDDSPAPDFTLASQATLFPVFLEAVSNGDENYYLTEVPHSAIEVVKRGREFVQKFREEDTISLLDPTGWGVLQPIVHQWWCNDAMPLLYGSGYEGWKLEEPYTRDQMLTWRDKEMSRALEFPKIFDGFELVRKYGDEIREETGLPEFSRQVMKTRIQAHG